MATPKISAGIYLFVFTSLPLEFLSRMVCQLSEKIKKQVITFIWTANLAAILLFACPSEEHEEQQANRHF